MNDFVTWWDLLKLWVAWFLGRLFWIFVIAFFTTRRDRRREETIRRGMRTAERQWDRLRSGRDPLA